MLLTLTTVAIDSSVLTTRGAQINYCFKPSRQSWDFIDLEDGFKATNLAIDTFKFSCPTDEALVKGKLVGDKLTMTLGNGVETITGNFLITDIAIKDGYKIITTMVSGDLTEAKVA